MNAIPFMNVISTKDECHVGMTNVREEVSLSKKKAS